MGGLSCHPMKGPKPRPFQPLRGCSLSASHLTCPPVRSLVGQFPRIPFAERPVFPKPEPVGWEDVWLVRSWCSIRG
jgi:hypothetical protein